MASHPRNREREDERRLSIRTLAIASIASATAALVTSQFWEGGTPYAAAFTPVIVALVSEMLHRPTEKIAERMPDREALGLRTPLRRTGEPPSVRRPAEPESGQPPVPTGPTPRKPPPTEAGPVPVNVYKQPAPRRRRIALGAVLATGVLAFAIAAAALTLPELIAGQSIGKSDRKSTFFGGHHRSKSRNQEQQPQQTTPTRTQTTPTTTSKKDQQKQSTTPAQGRDNQQTTPQQTTPSAQPTP